jgi:hypothetical protein
MAEQFAGTNADYGFGPAFAVDSFGGAAQLWSLGERCLILYEWTDDNILGDI